MLSWLKSKAAAWSFPEHLKLIELSGALESENAALRAGLTAVHGKSINALQTLCDIIAVFVFQQGSESITLSGDLLAAAHASGTIDVQEGEDGSITLKYVWGDAPCEHGGEHAHD